MSVDSAVRSVVFVRLLGGVFFLTLAFGAPRSAAQEALLRIQAVPETEEGQLVVDYRIRSDLPDGARIQLRLESLFGSGVLGQDFAILEDSRAEGRMGPFDWELVPGRYELVAECVARDQTVAIFEAMGGAEAAPVQGSAAFILGPEVDVAEAYFHAKVRVYDDVLRVARCHGVLIGKAPGDPGAELLDLARRLRERRNDTRGDPIPHAPNALLTLVRSLLAVGAGPRQAPGERPEAGGLAGLEGIDLPESEPEPQPEAEPRDEPAPLARAPVGPDADFLLKFDRLLRLMGLVEMEEEWTRFGIEILGESLDALAAALERTGAGAPPLDRLEAFRAEGARTLALIESNRSLDLLEISPTDVSRRQSLAAEVEGLLSLAGRLPAADDRIAEEYRMAVAGARARIGILGAFVRFAREAPVEEE